MSTLIEPILVRDRRGLPAYFADLPGPTTGALMFRVGTSDESLVQRGFTHLIEHLTLHDIDDPALQWNGFVDVNRTVFHATGPHDRVEAFLRTVAARLGALPHDRLEAERQVLAAESRRRGSQGVFAELMSRRWGAAGWGTCGWWELGLRNADFDAIDAWRRRHFTRGNAALWMTSPPSQSLLVDLDEGERIATCDPAPVVAGRAWFRHDTAGVSFMSRIDRSASAVFAVQHLTETFQRELRGEGLCYSAQSLWQRLDAGRAATMFTCDTTPQREGQLVSRMLQLLDQAPDAFSAGALAAMRARRAAAPDSPEDETRARLDAWTLDLLFGRPPTTVSAERADEEQCTVASVFYSLRKIREDALLMVPPGVGVNHRDLPPYPSPQPADVGGRRHRFAVFFEPRDRDGSLQIGDRGLSVQSAESGTSVRWPDVAAVMRWTDGTRLVVDRSGNGVTVEPHRYHGGPDVVRAIDDRTDRALAVDVGARYSTPPAKMAGDTTIRVLRIARTALVAVSLISLLLGPLCLASGLAGDGTAWTVLGAALLVVGLVVGPIFAVWSTPRPRSFVWDDAHHRASLPDHLDRSAGSIPGGLLLGWVAARGHLTPAWSAAFDDEIASLQAGSTTGPTLYRSMGGVLSDDMIDEICNEFFTDYLGQRHTGFDLDLRRATPGRATFYEIPDTWASQAAVIGVIDEAFARWRRLGRRRLLRHLRRVTSLGGAHAWRGRQADERAMLLVQSRRRRKWRPAKA